MVMIVTTISHVLTPTNDLLFRFIKLTTTPVDGHGSMVGDCLVVAIGYQKHKSKL